MKFGKYMGGSLQWLREEAWHSYDKDNVSLSFDALKVTHRVTEMTRGNRYSITLFTPGKLDRLTPKDWDTLARFGFPIYMYNVDSLQMRRLPEDNPIKSKIPRPTTADVNVIATANAAFLQQECGFEG